MTRTTPELAPTSPHQREGVWPSTYGLTSNRPIYTADLQWNRVSNLEPSGPEAEKLSPGHCAHLYKGSEDVKLGIYETTMLYHLS
ncbi:hypothetical protein AVEN_212491-1 [Araneus ventricosus]|uniref:Uncharacterized protein n=1 Tax=Araneus ventricosus TaxID=182803 RepID=A0A4Y2K2L5_ARAVE|nr:hypothetical protein AVEN_212491-1 [Araneus ventricosus]